MKYIVGSLIHVMDCYEDRILRIGQQYSLYEGGVDMHTIEGWEGNWTTKWTESRGAQLETFKDLKAI